METKRAKKFNTVSFLVLCIAVPVIVIGGAWIFKDRQYAWITLCVAVLACVPFFLLFEKKEADGRVLVTVAVMCALSVAGRVLFAPVPGFKPVTAMVIITAMYFGSEAGFVTGAFSALVSNFYFGQGPWTPFQMFVWGLIGFVSGLCGSWLKKNRVFLTVFAIISGVVFSLVMDIWTVLWADGIFNVTRYAAAVISSVQFIIIYAVSNVVFLFFPGQQIGRMLERIKTKYMG